MNNTSAADNTELVEGKADEHSNVSSSPDTSWANGGAALETAAGLQTATARAPLHLGISFDLPLEPLPPSNLPLPYLPLFLFPLPLALPLSQPCSTYLPLPPLL